jgi:hypothetical protein
MIRDKRLFAFLKDRKIFTGAGRKTWREYMDFKETQRENGDRARHPRKKARK